MKSSLSYAFGVLTLSLVLAASPADAQTVANGPYYAVPSWDQTLPAAQRFIVLANFNQEAVLDRETGLVWQRTPHLNAPAFTGWRLAQESCMVRVIGGRMGWRMPSGTELGSLVDPASFNGTASPALPPGHPFLNVAGAYWTVTTRQTTPDHGVAVNFHVAPPLSGGSPQVFLSREKGVTLDSFGVWCVRGGADASATGTP